MTKIDDYDNADVIRSVACRMGIPGFHPQSGKSLEELFDLIEGASPEVADIIREKVYAKDTIKKYVESNPANVEWWNGMIVTDRDAALKKFCKDDTILYDELVKAIDKYTATTGKP